MFKKLRNSMLIFNMTTLTITILAAFSLIYFVTYSNLERENNRRLQSMSNMGLPVHIKVRVDSPRLPERFTTNNSSSFFLLTKDGTLEYVDSYLEFDDEIYAEALEKTGDKTEGKITLNGARWAFLSSPVQQYESEGEQYIRIVFIDITDSIQVLRELLITLICVGLVVLLILLFFSYRFSVRAIRPIEDGYNRQKQFVADASHELRTPIAIVSANVDAIETNSEKSVESQKEWFGYIHTEIHRTNKLIDDLLYLAKVEDTKQLETIPFDLSLTCETACTSIEAILYENEITLETKIEKNLYIVANEEKIKQVIYILLDNAGKYTNKRGKVTFELSNENEFAKIQVTNTGDGISSEELPKIFDRFYRPDTSRSQDTGGFGLGLSIAKTIVERSNGKISVQSDNKQTTFTIHLKIT